MSKTFLTKKIITEAAKKFSTPYHIYDEKGIRENARGLNKAFSFNKGYKEYFAVKATPNPVLLKIFQEEGFGVDCSSYTELLMAKACGFSGDGIMFSSNETADYEYKLARQLNAIINLDDITHIEFLEKAAGLPEKICLRYNPGGDFVINNTIMGSPNDAKYGLTRQQMTDAVKILMSKGVKKFGIHSFLASNTVGNEYYPVLAGKMFNLAVELHKETGAEIDFVNLSGGIGIPYRPEQQKVDINVVADAVRVQYEKTLFANGMDEVKIFTELGRYMTGPYGNMVTKVIHFKHIYKEYVGVDSCAANLMRPAMYGSYHEITVIGKEFEPAVCTYDVVGSLCENNDKFAIDRKLPRIDYGDYLVFHDTGAHGFAMGYNYNGKLRSAELLLKSNGEIELIRRAETPEDYFATFDILIDAGIDFEKTHK